MRKIISGFVCAAVLCTALAACGGSEPSAPSGETASTAQEQTAQQAGEEAVDGTVIETDYGSYTLPGGWVQLDMISTEAKPFYVKEGVPTDSVIGNISVEQGTNRYTLQEHEQFRTAILQQLAMQAGGDTEAIQGSGRNTAAGDILYVFTMEDSGVRTVQYYVLDEKRYVLIHVTDFGDERIPDILDVADAMADSFVWA